MGLPAILELFRGMNGLIRQLPDVIRAAAEARAMEPPLEDGAWRQKEVVFEGSGFRGRIVIREGRGTPGLTVESPQEGLPPMKVIDVEPVRIESSRLPERALPGLPAPRKLPEAVFDPLNPPKRRWKRR